MTTALFVARVIAGAGLLAFATLALVTTVGAQIVNARAVRRRERAGQSHVGASHVSGTPLVATVTGILAAALVPLHAVRVAALGVVGADVVPILVALLVHAIRASRRSRTESSRPPR
ncbi:hypothetical protein BH11MYX2_BH11MYX2_18940 [soil metagenome]